MAEKHLRYLRNKNSLELQQAYDRIHPTRTQFDYSLGVIYKESVDPVECAICLVELREKHEEKEMWWKLRAEACKEALEMLTDDEKRYLHSRDYESYAKREKARNKLRELLTEIVEARPELQRQPTSLNELKDLEEIAQADRKIDSLRQKELFEDYRDFTEVVIEEPIKELKLGKKKNSYSPRTNEKRLTLVDDVKISYLPPEELEKYRTGKNGGSKWYTYEDYLKMKEDGRTNKEIALSMGIELDELNKRVKAWRYKIILLESGEKVKEKPKKRIVL